MATPIGTSDAVKNKLGHLHEPAKLAIMRYDACAFAATGGAAAGVLFAQVRCADQKMGNLPSVWSPLLQAYDVETVVHVRHFRERRLVDDFPRYFLPHQRLPVLNLSVAAPSLMEESSEANAAELLKQVMAVAVC